MKFARIDKLILPMSVQALGITTVHAPMKEDKSIEEVMRLVAPVMMRIIRIQDLPILELLGTTITYRKPIMMSWVLNNVPNCILHIQEMSMLLQLLLLLFKLHLLPYLKVFLPTL